MRDEIFGPVLHYVLDDAGRAVPVDDAMTWARWFERADRKLADTKVGRASVSTIFLGIDHSFGEGPPVLWETMVFGGPADTMTVRYHSAEEARAGHDVVCAYVRSRSTVRGWLWYWFREVADWLYGLRRG